jgi:predicted MFS family arabinose efflux permease
MAEMVKTPAPIPPSFSATQNVSAWAPLRETLFRSLWIAAVISYIGTWMQSVGAGWMMTVIDGSPLMVGLVQAAVALPVFLVILPAGALADMVDRRRFLLITQGWMVLASGTLGVLTLFHVVTPWILLAFTFVLGLGAVMNDPAWQAITPELVPAEHHAAAVAMNSAGFNVARAVGPALGGMVIAAAGSGTAFLLNALSFFGVIIVLYRWKRPPAEKIEAEALWEAVGSGIAYVRRSPLVQSVLIRTGAFSVGAIALLALLPILARPFGATGYGVLLGCFGFGALAGATILPRLRRRLSVDGLVATAIVVFATMTFAAGRVQGFPELCAVLGTAGAAWIGILACLNTAAQTMSPSWVRARALSMYLLVLQGGMAIGSTLWGALATRVGLPNTLLCSALALIGGLLTIRRHRLSAQHLAMAPSVIRD